ncbi:MAG TPA: DUF3710 domain-containing protein, partial [Dermatophilaceae bacterium]|nr:DUF3710 domain-containing protein [Dermatophilaceae bacterium]
MGIFRRGNKDTSAERDQVVPGSSGTEADAKATASSHPAVSRSRGPFDRSEVEGLDGRLDLGALWLTGVPGMELRLEVEEASQSLVGVTAVL